MLLCERTVRISLQSSNRASNISYSSCKYIYTLGEDKVIFVYDRDCETSFVIVTSFLFTYFFLNKNKKI